MNSEFNSEKAILPKPIEYERTAKFVDSKVSSRRSSHSKHLKPVEKQETYPGLNKDMSFADQLPNRHFIDKNLNEKILMSGPPTIDSDSEFNRHSTIMSQVPKAGNTIYSSIP